MRLTVAYLLITTLSFNLNAQKSTNATFVKNQIQQLSTTLRYYAAIEKSQTWRQIHLPSDSLIYWSRSAKVIDILRNNLCLTGDLPEDVITINSHEVDSAIFYSLKNFQGRHGLKQTGKLDKETLDAINVPICDRIDQIRVNIKRWEQFLLADENLFVLVNIPDYSLQVVKNGRAELNLKVVVGKPTTPTVVFYDQIEQLVINPSWVVPTNIIKRELFEKIKTGPEYLRQQHFKLYAYGKKVRKEISWEDINWTTITASTFNYSVEQVPGPWNSLGKIKFLFPNNNDIYLHDTPEKELFRANQRAYSHGCVRVEKPVQLAEFILKETTTVSKASLHQDLNRQETTKIQLDSPVPIALSYFTCFIDDNDAVHFRKDIYQLDIFEEDDMELLGRL